jgi:spermidine synthase
VAFADAMRLILFLGGAAALGWQIVWAHPLGLALGASARGVALTVATAMAGMTLGSLLCARLLREARPVRPLLLYGALELLVGLCALLPGVAEGWIMELDGAIHRRWPGGATLFTLLALAAAIGPACLAMGATLPAMGLLAKDAGRPLSRLYALNTAGAASGALLVAFALVPALGLHGAAFALFATHAVLGLACALIALRPRAAAPPEPQELLRPALAEKAEPTPPAALRPASLAFLSGAAAFVLEVAWFRSLRSAWFSTADSLAAMLFCFLVALALGAALAPLLRRRGIGLGASFAGAAVLVVVATSLIARFDLVEVFQSRGAMRQTSRILAGLVTMGPPVALVGIALPTLLDRGRGPRDWALLYASNTLGAVVGANLAAWILLEALGPLATGWFAAGLLAAGAAVALTSWPGRAAALATATAAILLAVQVERGQGQRAQGAKRSLGGESWIVESRHGPDASLSVVGFPGGNALVINGFVAAAEASDPRLRYMDAMGRVPMLLHPDPREALVICFGTGQTAHAVRDEGPRRLDIADLNAAVFEMAGHFRANHDVLADPRVRPIVMDGRAWLRRGDRRYDVVTLEPMPPFFSGSNALYSVEFYELVKSRLEPGGILAQWFPLHLMTPEQAASVAAAFVAAFPDSILWFDPGSIAAGGLYDQGILLGRLPGGGGEAFGEAWPGYFREAESGQRPLPSTEARASLALGPDALRRFAEGAAPVTDGNALLEYRPSPYRAGDLGVKETVRLIHERIEAARQASDRADL